METTTTNKTQVNTTTTGTSTSYTINSPPPTEYGWACPRCGRVNAPWKSQCDCPGYNWNQPYYDEWWKKITCTPGTTWQVPSSVCQTDTKTEHKVGDNTTAWNVKVDGNTYTGNSNLQVGGSDYYNPATNTYENVPSNETNKIESNKNEDEPALRVQTLPEDKQQEKTLDDAYEKFCNSIFERESKKQEKKQKKTGKYFRD